MRAERMIREYGTLKKELSVLEFQLKQFKGVDEDDIILSMQLAHPEGGDRVQTSTTSDKTASVAMNYKNIAERENEEWYNHLWSRYRFVKEEIEFFEHSVTTLHDSLPGIIMDLVEGRMTWESMAAKYHVSTTMISKYKKTAIKELDFLYELRDQQTETYILS